MLREKLIDIVAQAMNYALGANQVSQMARVNLAAVQEQFADAILKEIGWHPTNGDEKPPVGLLVLFKDDPEYRPREVYWDGEYWRNKVGLVLKYDGVWTYLPPEEE